MQIIKGSRSVLGLWVKGDDQRTLPDFLIQMGCWGVRFTLSTQSDMMKVEWFVETSKDVAGLADGTPC